MTAAWARNSAILGLLLVLLGVAAPSMSLPTEIVIFAIAALGFNLLYGLTGLLSFGQSVFFGGAAYLVAMALQRMPGLEALSITLLGGVAGLLLALVFSLISMRTKGIYFVMLTLAFSQVAFFMVLAFSGVTGGENGMRDVPRPDPSLFGFRLIDIQRPGGLYVYCAIVLWLCFLWSERLTRSPFGAVLGGIRQNEMRAEVLGYRTNLYKLAIFCIAGFMTGMAGALYALFLRFVPLNSIDFETSEKVVIMTILGGTGSNFGPLLGAAAYILLGDILSPIWPRWLLLIGLVLIGVVMFFNGGLIELVERAWRAVTRRGR